VPTTIISGWFRFCAPSVNPLARLLPPLILVKADQAQSLALHTTLNMLASEMADMAPGSDLVVNRLADLLFIHSIRAYIRSRSETCKNGLLRAIFDPQIGSALKSMHERVEHRWTVESLAASSGMSRSAFAVRFKDLVGETPLEYLTGWRMQKATGLLQKGDKKVFEVTKSPLPTIPTMPLAKRSSEYSVSHPGSIDEVPQGHRRVYLTQVVALKFQYGDGRFRLSAHRHNSRIRLMGKCTAASAFLVLDPRN
jgi:AraC-like DNA-binding protein